MKDNCMIVNSDCLEVLKEIPDNYVDSLITDPPAGISFMGKSWDEDKGGRKQWIVWMSGVMTECMRVMKPGAHGFVWAIPRTSHWTATALEDAGFEIRDVVTHIFGSGFPKSMDISKAIDKAAGAEREVVGTLKTNTGMQGGKFDSNSEQGIVNVTAPSTPEAKQWQGWGTALKPASEHWILVRKPISEKTVGANVLKHGTGGINIDASRIGTEQRINKGVPSYQGSTGTFSGQGEIPIRSDKMATGRFPANLVLSHNPDCEEKCTPRCAVIALDEQSGELKGPWGKNSKEHVGKDGESSMFKIGGVNSQNELRGKESGGASRFFYCAKASKKDKGADNTHPTVKSSTLMSYLIKMITPPNGIVLDPFMGSGSTGVATLKEGFDLIGIEKEAEYFEIAKKRLESV